MNGIWHTVSATEPKPLDDVLVVVEDDIGTCVWMAWRLHTEPHRWCYTGGDDEISGRVTHWMPVPEPPEEVRHARRPDRSE